MSHVSYADPIASRGESEQVFQRKHIAVFDFQGGGGGGGAVRTPCPSRSAEMFKLYPDKHPGYH